MREVLADVCAGRVRVSARRAAGPSPFASGLLFAFTAFWGYIAFSQMMLIWIANLPEEIPFFMVRMKGAWAPVGVALIFGQLFADQFGAINNFLGIFGIEPIRWHVEPLASHVAIATMVNFRWTGYNALILLAAMQAIPRDYYEAATLDGAGRIRQFLLRHAGDQAAARLLPAGGEIEQVSGDTLAHRAERVDRCLLQHLIQAPVQFLGDGPGDPGIASRRRSQLPRTDPEHARWLQRLDARAGRAAHQHRDPQHITGPGVADGNLSAFR